MHFTHVKCIATCLKMIRRILPVHTGILGFFVQDVKKYILEYDVSGSNFNLFQVINYSDKNLMDSKK